MRAAFNELDVRVHGVARGGQNSFAANGLNARQAGCFHEMKPLFDSALLVVIAVVIDQAFAPRDAKDGIVAARKQCGILDRNAALIVVAIERPRLQLPARERSFMHQRMKRVLMVITLFADRRKSGNEFGFRQRRLFGRVHSCISMPSWAISKPASSTARRSALSSIKIGFVLLMCSRIFRALPPVGYCASKPSGPASGVCPISLAVFLPRPACFNSPSLQKVPSSNARSLATAHCFQFVSRPGREGATKIRLPENCKSSATTASSGCNCLRSFALT